MAETPAKRFQLIWSEQNREAIRKLAARAIGLGLRNEFAASLLDLDEELTMDPLGWGDPQFLLKSTGILVCHGIHRFVHLVYGVHEQQRIVFIKEVWGWRELGE